MLAWAELAAHGHHAEMRFAIHLIFPGPDLAEAASEYYEQRELLTRVLDILLVIFPAAYLVALITFWKKATSLKRMVRRKNLVALDPPPGEFICVLESVLDRLQADLPPCRVLWHDDDSYAVSVLETRGVVTFILSSGFLVLCVRHAHHARVILAHEVGHILMHDSALWLNASNAAAVLMGQGMPLTFVAAFTVNEFAHPLLSLAVCFLAIGCYYTAIFTVFALRRRSERLADTFAVSAYGVELATRALQYVLAETPQRKTSFIHPSKRKRLAFLQSSAMGAYIDLADANAPTSDAQLCCIRNSPRCQFVTNWEDVRRPTPWRRLRTGLVKRLAIACLLATATIGVSMHVFAPHATPVRLQGAEPRDTVLRNSRLAWSADGKDVLIGSSEGWLERRSTEGAQVWLKTDQDKGEINQLAWSADGKRVMVINSSLTVRSSANGDPILRLSDSEDFTAGALNRDGTEVATAGYYSAAVKFWPVKPGDIKIKKVIPLAPKTRRNFFDEDYGDDDQPQPVVPTKRVSGLAWRPQGDVVAAANENGTISMFAAKCQQPVSTFKAHDSQVLLLQWSHDGTWLLSYGADGIVRIWDALNHYAPVGRIDAKGDGSLTQLSLSTDHEWLALIGLGATTIWMTKTAKQVLRLPGSSAGSFSPDGEHLIEETTENGLIVWSLKNPLWLQSTIARVYPSGE
jgi:hypothetical protein